MFVRLLAGVLLLGLVACGEPPGQGASVTESLFEETTSVAPATTTSTLAPTTTTSTVAPTTATFAVIAAPTPLTEFGVEPGRPIEPVPDFPEPADMAGDIASFPQARISSRFDVSDRARNGSDQQYEYLITYLDDYTIWDYPDGSREVRPQGGDFLYLADDGSWQVSERFEWPPIPLIPEWEMAQLYVERFVDVGVDVIGYEEIAGAPTVHLRWSDTPTALWADMWVTENGTVLRMVVDLGLEDPERSNEAWLIWDVLTLDPQDVGPLPPSG